MRIRVHRVPFSTNVERVALGAGIKRAELEWVDHADEDRSAVVALSGQALVPVAELDGAVIVDSVAILRRLDAELGDPPLWPIERGGRARAEIFVAWFDEVWKIAPNAIADAPGDPRPGHVESLRESADWFDALAQRGDFLAGERPGIEDVCAYPFLRYAVDPPDPGDDQPFHRVLHDHLSQGSHPALDRWVARMAELPRA